MSRVYLAIFLLVLAPIAAAVVITALLLFGAAPKVVFAPGNGMKWLLEYFGLRVANRVAVASTLVFFWALIAAAGLLWERHRRAAGGRDMMQ